MGMPAQLNIVTLGVADLDRSIVFYEALGWTRAKSSVPGEIAWFKTAGAYLGLFSFESLAEDAASPSVRDGGFGDITLAANVLTPEAVEDAIAAAEAAGATVLKPATRLDWGGVSGYFADPDGYPWEVACNPSFPVREDGNIDIP